MSQIGSIYGGALYNLCKDEGLSRSVLQELDVLNQAFQNDPGFLRLLVAPNVPVRERCEILNACFRDKVHIYVLNFMKILTEKGLTRHFDACVASYRALFNHDHNILTVKAVTAVPMSEQQCSRLTDKMSQITGKTVTLSNRIDPSCYGGVRLEYDGKCIDGSISHRLERIRDMLKNTVL